MGQGCISFAKKTSLSMFQNISRLIKTFILSLMPHVWHVCNYWSQRGDICTQLSWNWILLAVYIYISPFKSNLYIDKHSYPTIPTNFPKSLLIDNHMELMDNYRFGSWIISIDFPINTLQSNIENGIYFGATSPRKKYTPGAWSRPQNRRTAGRFRWVVCCTPEFPADSICLVVQ